MSSMPDETNLVSLVETLRATAAGTDKDDLRMLAKMHGWCETIASGKTAGAENADPRLFERAAELARHIEMLILGETPDSQVTFTKIMNMIEGITPLAACGESSSDAAAVATAGSGTDQPTAGSDALRHLETLTKELSSFASRVDQDDLQGLAEMAGICQRMADHARQTDSQALIAEKAADLATHIEQLVLREVSDAGAACAAIIEAANRLSDMVLNTYEGQPGSLTTQSDGEHIAVPSDEEVRARLDMVFSPQPEKPTAAPEPARAAATPTQPSPQPATSATAPAAAPEPPYESEPLIIDNKELEFIKAFVEEAGEHIESIEQALLDVERAPTNLDKINDLFRPFHTIKGMAGFLHLRDVNCLTHEAETFLDQARKGKRPVTPGLIDLVFNVIDILKAQVASLAVYLTNPTGQPIPQPPVSHMIHLLRDVVAGRIEPGSQATPAGAAGMKVGETLISQGAVAEAVVDFALDKQKSDAPDKKVGEILMDLGAVNAKQVSQAIRAQGPAVEAAPKTVVDTSIRIDTAKLDSLVDMVGELVIAQTLVQANSTIATDIRLSRDVDQVSKIIRDVQEVAMGMRMIPIGPTFQKMARLVRDLSRKISKQVNLTISGEDTELDKNVIQLIGDPLVHMVRNAVDHGLETPEARAAAGKNPVGQVHLHAGHQGGNIIIEISDDGKGLDAKVLIAKGIEKGLVQPGEELTEQQAFGLIMQPGFSTAAQVTDVSGRGVGMDVVRRNIDQLRGKVDISSRRGEGTTFTIRLPLTLAIIDGMIIRLGTERFIIPTIAIEQSIRPLPSQICSVLHKGEVLNVRGQLVPLIQLGQMFGLTPHINPADTMVVIAQCEGRQIGLVVEELIGQQQVVIKTLGRHFERLKGISGAAILGDGRVGLILEMGGLAELHAGNAVQRLPGHDLPPTYQPGAANPIRPTPENGSEPVAGDQPTASA